MGRDGDLSGVWARCMNALVKSDWRPAQSFERHRTSDVSQPGQSLSTMQREGTDGAHRLRSIEKREAFFYFQLQRRNLRAFECGGCRQPFTFVKNFSFADRCEREMCKRGEITA